MKIINIRNSSSQDEILLENALLNHFNLDEIESSIVKKLQEELFDIYHDAFDAYKRVIESNLYDSSELSEYIDVWGKSKFKGKIVDFISDKLIKGTFFDN
jgi:hypothetical protein